MEDLHVSPSERAKELLVDVFKEMADVNDKVLTDTQIKKIKEAVDNIMAEASA